MFGILPTTEEINKAELARDNFKVYLIYINY